MSESWYVVDYDEKPLPGDWLTEEEAVEQGLCSKYLLSGYEVRQGPRPTDIGRDRVDGSEPSGVSPTTATERPSGWADAAKSDPSTPHIGRPS